jgi:hypothetical protein
MPAGSIATPPVSPHTLNTFLWRVGGKLDIHSGVEFACSVAPRVRSNRSWTATVGALALSTSPRPTGSNASAARRCTQSASTPATLGMPFDLVRKAADRVDRSPLLEMLTRHVLDVARVADTIPPGPARSALGAATAELFRAVLSTALTGADIPLEASGPTLLTMTRMYVDRHITDSDLTPGHIARAHNVSLRHLYAAWSGNDVSLAAYVMAQRLELARSALTERGSRTRTIAAIAAVRVRGRDALLAPVPRRLRRVTARVAPTAGGY